MAPGGVLRIELRQRCLPEKSRVRIQFHTDVDGLRVPCGRPAGGLRPAGADVISDRAGVGQVQERYSDAQRALRI